MNSNLNELIKRILNDEEIQQIKTTTIKHKHHPLKRLLYPEYERDEQIAANTEIALRNIFVSEPNWTLNKKSRKKLVQFSNYANASSVLGEIRTFGYLIQAGLSVKSLPEGDESQPDFSFEENNHTVFLEVNSPQEIDQNKRSNIRVFRSPEGIVEESTYTPFKKPRREEGGKPIPKDSLIYNAIVKFTQIKETRKKKEPQFKTNDTSLLWLDFQDAIWNGLSVAEALPVRIDGQILCSGIIWYAFYARKGDPIFQNYNFLENSLFQSSDLRPEMRHEGRFSPNRETPTNIDAVIISFPRDTIIFENPDSQKPIKEWLWKKLFFLPWFKFEYSYINWPATNLKQKIELRREDIIALSNVSP